jgi:hypothetical protein
MYKLENDSSKDGEEAALADEFWTTGIIRVTEGPESQQYSHSQLGLST